MATSKSRLTSPEKVTEKAVGTESVYTIDELVKAHKALNASYDIVAVSLRLSGKQTMTIEEAKSIIEKFKKQEVK